MKHPVVALAALLASLALSCAPSTRVVAAWKDPDLGTVIVERPLVVFQHPSEPLRRSVEDALAERIPGAVPAYEVIPTGEIFDVEGVQRRVKEAGFDTVMISRLVDVKEQVELAPGEHVPGYDPLWRAWSGGWSDVAGPAYLNATTVVTLESLLYTVKGLDEGSEGQLVWASRSETFDPRSFEGLATSVARASVKAMSKDGLVVAASDRE